ncbi:uncharacterized protein J3R85_017536 [Psidium guajava]|nr:uncharacterized protein J3R85_017536 [Psidium guajava]
MDNWNECSCGQLEHRVLLNVDSLRHHSFEPSSYGHLSLELASAMASRASFQAPGHGRLRAAMAVKSKDCRSNGRCRHGYSSSRAWQ